MTSVTDAREIECPLLDEDDAFDKNYTSPVDYSSPSSLDDSEDAMGGGGTLCFQPLTPCPIQSV